MYGKIHVSMYDSTLAEDWRALITFQQMIALCDADGIVDMTPTALQRRTGIPIEHIEAGIKFLENPDPYSRTPDEDGRRIVRIDEHRPWGWLIVNYGKYRALADSDTVREQTRERVRRYRERRAQQQIEGCDVTECNGDVTGSNGSNAPLRETETETESLSTPVGVDGDSKGIPTCPQKQIISLWKEIHPQLTQPKTWDGTRSSNLRTCWRIAPDIEKWREFFEWIKKSDFLMGRKKCRDGKPFKLTLDWLVKPTNFKKAIEGQYHG